MKPANDNPLTKVIFRRFSDGEVIALFPAIAGTNDPYTCQSYSHLGQHGSASVNIAQNTKPASETEYKALKDELENYIGYRLMVCQRFTLGDLYERHKQLKGINS